MSRRPKRAGPLERSRLRPRNEERRERLHHSQYDGDIKHAEWIRSLSCVVCHYQGPHLQAAHFPSKGAGGTYENLIPLCGTRMEGGTMVEGCHQRQHRLGDATWASENGWTVEEVRGMGTTFLQAHLHELGEVEMPEVDR